MNIGGDMGVIVKEMKRSSKSHAFYDGDLKRMERSGFRAKGWNTYADSPYAEYQRRLAEHEAPNKDNSRTDRPDN